MLPCIGLGVIDLELMGIMLYRSNGMPSLLQTAYELGYKRRFATIFVADYLKNDLPG